MKIRYCVSLLLLCAATIFSKSTTVKAEDKYYKFLEKYFTIEEKYKSKWGQQDGFTYLCEKKDNTVTIVGIPMDKKKVVVPAKINGKKVVKISIMPAFDWAANEEYRNEFYGEHEDVPIPKVEYLSIPKTVKVIDCYEGGWLNEGYCKGMQSFLQNLKKFNVASGNKWYRSYKGVLYTKNGKKLITVPRKYTAKTVKVKKGTTKIADSAFSFCTNIKKVILPDTVKVIEQNAFVRCSLNYIRMPRRLKILEVTAFRSSALKKITVYGKVELDETFKYCKKLKTVVLKKGVKELGELVFHECPKLRSVTVPKGIKNLGWNIDSIFYYRGLKCNLSNITIKTPKNSEMYKERKFLKKRYKKDSGWWDKVCTDLPEIRLKSRISMKNW